MWCSAGSRPSLVDVVFEYNDPNGIRSEYSSPELTGVTFQRNWGSGMSCRAGAPVLTDVVFQGNHGSGLSLVYGADAVLTDVVFWENGSLNSAGGLYCFHSSPSVSGCTFYRNGSGMWGGGMRIHGDTSAPIVRNCTFFGNDAVVGGGAIHGEGSPVFERLIIAWNDGPEPFDWFGDCPALACCDIYGNAGGDWVGCISDQLGVNGNFSACPSFCNAAGGDFRLCDQSPCLPGNHPYGYDCGIIGAWGEGCICGPSRVETTTWGAVKSLYRQ
jgi:predicted outer membrane repeat protein